MLRDLNIVSGVCFVCAGELQKLKHVNLRFLYFADLVRRLHTSFTLRKPAFYWAAILQNVLTIGRYSDHVRLKRGVCCGSQGASASV